MAYVVDSAPRFPERPFRLQLEHLSIPRIAIGILVELGRVPWTFLAARMLARLALLGPRSEHRPTGMTSASDPLADGLADKVLPAGARGQRQRCVRVARQLEVRV